MYKFILLLLVASLIACNSHPAEKESPGSESTVDGAVKDVKEAGKDVGEAVGGAAKDVKEAVKGSNDPAEDAREAEQDAKEEAHEASEDKKEGDL